MTLYLQALTQNERPAPDESADDFVKQQVVRRLLKFMEAASKRSITSLDDKAVRAWERKVKTAKDVAFLGERIIECYNSIDPVFYKPPAVGLTAEEKKLARQSQILT